jgi:hypothetical protein
MFKGIELLRVINRGHLLLIDGKVRFGDNLYGRDHSFSATVGYAVHEVSQVPISQRMLLDPTSADCSFIFVGGIPKEWENEDIRHTATDIFYMIVDQMLPELHAKWTSEQAAA